MGKLLLLIADRLNLCGPLLSLAYTEAMVPVLLQDIGVTSCLHFYQKLDAACTSEIEYHFGA
jgi:hypothetical protein